MALGNVIGSNIANIWLILGTTAVFAPIIVDARAVMRDALMLLGSSIVFTWLCLTGEIVQIAGGGMLLLLMLYFLRSYLRERGDGTASAHLHEREAEEFQDIKMGALMAWVSLIGGLAAVAFGADLLVGGGTIIARDLGVPEEVIGLTILAFGTSLPELAASGVAAWRGHTDVAIGNVIGSNLFNLLAVAGGVAAITPLAVPDQLRDFDLWVMMIATMMVLAFLVMGARLHRREGLLFLTAYGLYITAQAMGVDQVKALLG